MSVSSDEIDAKIKEIASNEARPLEEVKKYFEERGIIEDIRHEMLYKKVMDFLHENAVKKPAAKTKPKKKGK